MFLILLSNHDCYLAPAKGYNLSQRKPFRGGKHPKKKRRFHGSPGISLSAWVRLPTSQPRPIRTEHTLGGDGAIVVLYSYFVWRIDMLYAGEDVVEISSNRKWEHGWFPRFMTQNSPQLIRQVGNWTSCTRRLCLLCLFMYMCCGHNVASGRSSLQYNLFAINFRYYSC